MVGGCTRLSCFRHASFWGGVLVICGHASQSPLEVGLLATINRTPVEEGHLCCLVDLVNQPPVGEGCMDCLIIVEIWIKFVCLPPTTWLLSRRGVFSCLVVFCE